MENGAPIDASGTRGKAYKGCHFPAAGFARNPATPNCVVQRAYEYGVGRERSPGDEKWLEFARRSRPTNTNSRR
jgi:hypothetical protein